MHTDAKTITPLPGFVLRAELVDGRRGKFDASPHLGNPALAALRDPAYFARASVIAGAVTWPDGEDIEPATLAAELQSDRT